MLTEKEIASHKKFITSREVKRWIGTMLSDDYTVLIKATLNLTVETLNDPFRINVKTTYINFRVDGHRSYSLAYYIDRKQFAMLEKKENNNTVILSSYPPIEIAMMPVEQLFT